MLNSGDHEPTVVVGDRDHWCSRVSEFMTYACAFCGEENETVVDPSAGRRQTYTEDCAVCCRPNLLTLTLDDDGEVLLEATQEYEA